MTRILPHEGRPTGRPTALRLGLALLLAGGVVSAGTDQDPPDGLPAGPVFFAPWFQSEVLADDNIFRRSETQQQMSLVGLEDSDIATTLRAGVTAYIPIRMSSLELGYEGSAFFYKDSSFSDTDRHTGNMTFELNFSSHNKLRIEESYANGHTELQRALFDTIDDDTLVLTEIIRQGVPFSSNRWAVEWLRRVYGRPGWRARVERSYLRYRPEELTQDIPWNDYDSWDVEYEYDQPIYRRGEFTAMYTGRRREEFEPGVTSSFGLPDWVPLRREAFDALEVGFRGLIGRRQPLFVRLGYGKLVFSDVQGTGQEPSNYRGLVGNAAWHLPVGGRSNMAVNLNRLPLASIFNTYYLVNELRVLFDRRFSDVSLWGVSVFASSNGYGDLVSSETANGTVTLNCTTTVPDPVSGGNTVVPLVRHDRGQRVEGFWEWFVQPRVAVRMTATHNRSNSNCDEAGFRSNALGLTFKVGWF